MNRESVEPLLRDIHAYYGSQDVPVAGDRTALMLRATGEPWTSDEIASCASGTLSYDSFRRIAWSKYPAELFDADGQGSRRALVDDYGNVINLTVAECKEVVDAFKAIVHLRVSAGEAVQEAVIPVEYFRRVLTSMGDRLPSRYMDMLLSQLLAYNGNISLRALLKLLSRKL